MLGADGIAGDWLSEAVDGVDDGVVAADGGCIRMGSIGIESSSLLKESLDESATLCDPGWMTPFPVAYVPSIRSAISLNNGKGVFCHFFN